MSIAKLKLDESAKLEFDVLITGADGVPNARFVIEGKDFAVSYPCRQTNEGIEVEISGLKNVLQAGDYPAKLEIVLENKIYTPLQDTITFEPVVEINTKAKPLASIKESVMVGKINVTKKSNDDLTKKYAAANTIAEMLGYKPSLSDTPTKIVESALSVVRALPKSDLETLEEALKRVDSAGVTYDKSFVPSLLEKKVVHTENKDEDEEDEVEDDESDDEDEDEDEKEQKEEVAVKDTSDYKVSASGKKVKAHKIVFNKGEEETPKVSEEKKPSSFESFVSKRKKSMTEDIEQMSEEELFEVLKKTDPAGKWISDFVHSKNPKFAGKTTKERMKMALGAYYGAQRSEENHNKKVNESPLAKGLVRNLLSK